MQTSEYSDANAMPNENISKTRIYLQTVLANCKNLDDESQNALKFKQRSVVERRKL